MYLKKGAIFIADVHYPNHNKTLFKLLKKIELGDIKTPQLILMGDIFDLLIGESSYLKSRFKKEIEYLNKLSKKIEIIYIEGNHDFNLKSIFPDIKTISINSQPLITKYQNLTIALSHGDKYEMPLSYRVFTKFIRNRAILKILPEQIAKNKLKNMQNKKICKELKDFNTLAKKIVKNFNADLIVEGHYHQGKIVDNYISLPSFACSNMVGVFNGSSVEFISFPTLQA